MTSVSKTIDVGALAGRMLIESGAEMWRVEDTIKHIINRNPEIEAEAFTSLTGVLVNLQDDSSATRFVQVAKRGINMNKIHIINHLSRQYSENVIDIDELKQRLLELNKSKSLYPLWLQTIGAGLESAFLMITFTQKYDWFDLPITFVAGALGYIVAWYVGEHVRIRFMSEFLGALTVGISVVIGVRLHLGISISNIIIGAIMPLVPGVPMTTALRDIFEGNLLSGIERMIESLIVISAIAFGIGAVLRYA